MRLTRLLRLLVTVALIARTARAVPLLCNRLSSIATPFAQSLWDWYGVRAPSTPGAVSAKFHDDCIAAAKQRADDLCGGLTDNDNNMQRSRCYQDFDLAMHSYECKVVTDNLALYNLRFPSPISADAFVDFTVQVDGLSTALDYSSRLSAAKTAWFTVQFDAASVKCVTQDADLCANALFKLQTALFSQPFAVGTDTLLAGNTKLSPDIQYHADLKKTDARLIHVATGASRAGSAAFWTNGCTPPQFTLRVQFKAVRELVVPGAYSVTADNDGRFACYNRTIFVVAVSDLTPVLTCRMPYSINDLRRRLQTPLPENEAAARQAVVVAMRAQQYAYSTESDRQIRFCDAQINHILECVDPSSPTGIGGTWTPGQPGICARCAATANTHMRTRYCNASVAADRDKDCCFQCTTGYMMHPTAAPALCIAECKRNQEFSTQASGYCAPCAKGFVSNGLFDTCVTCRARGFDNARSDASRGCVPCGSRQLAVLDQCVPCPTKPEPQLVVQGACTTCTSRGAYFLPSGINVTACQPCPPGTFMLPSASTFCQTCPSASYASRPASLACAFCAVGYQSIPNRSACVPCPAINRTALPYSEYYQPGCNKRCIANTSYQYRNSYAVDGCRACTDIVLQVGTYADPKACNLARACTNAPSRGAYYTAAAARGNTSCPFQCIVGYSMLGGTCVLCVYDPTKYSPERHVPVAGAGCPYDCRAGLYRDGTKACLKPCVALVDEVYAAQIHLRVREYPANGTGRPSYLYADGVCGSADTAPRSEFPLLRRAWWAYRVDTYAAATCGNAVLERGEGCDDGNSAALDGCSALCQVETDRYWDCDLVGQPCLPDCGWKALTTDQWGISLRGFLLPACGTTNNNKVCQCHRNITYYDVSQMAVGARRPWMLAHLVPCNCGGNLLRTLPYEACTAANRGCRECAAGQYHDDLRGQCVACGSACRADYTADPNAALYCLPAFSTSQNLLHAAELSVRQQQAAIGCSPCLLPAGSAASVLYVASSAPCSFVCFKDTTGETAANDTYCSVKPLLAGCPGICLSCADKLLRLRADYATSPSPHSYDGLFIDQCRDAVGHTWAPCDPASKPLLATFTSPSLTVGASTACAWKCPADTTYLFHQTCLPCAATVACHSGERSVACDTYGKMSACVPCEGPVEFPWQVWTTTAPFRTCVPDCEPGVAYSDAPQQECKQCKHPVCALGERFVACTPRADAECQPCAQTATYGGVLPAAAEYVTPGLCSTRCMAGYYDTNVNGPQVVCAPCAAACLPGQNQTTYCVAPEDRQRPPVCQACPVALQPQQVWAAAVHVQAPPCEAVCAYQSVPLGPACVACARSLCPLGHAGLCADDWSSQTTQLQCTPCAAVGAREEFVAAGSCAKRCRAGFVLDQQKKCVLEAAPATAPATPPPDDPNGAPGIVYPSRARQHSAMALPGP